MGRDGLPPSSGYPSLPPETGEIDVTWDDLNLGDLLGAPSGAPHDDDSGDDALENRITAIPDIPMSELAAGLLAESDRNATSALPATVREEDLARVPSGRRGSSPLLETALSSPRLPRFEAAPPSAASAPEPDAAPPSWTEPDLELPISSTVEHPLTPEPAASRGGERRPDPDFDAVFAAHPLMQIPGGPPAPEGSTPWPGSEDAFGPARDQLPTLDLGTDLEEPPMATRRGSDAAAARDAPPRRAASSAPGGRGRARPTDAPATARVGRRSSRGRTGIELAREPTPPPTARSPHQDLHDRYAVGDFTGALVVAESILEQEPDDLEAARYAQSCRDVLTQMYSSRVGALDAPVRMVIPPDQIRWLSLDHRAGFLLSLVDGASTVEEILDICGMPRLDALRLLYMLLEERVIAVERRGR
ncbi:MAG TPA: hypothetical protein PLU22_03040 [Polyangiaceae bacterium]|nr:hypothetical protein [Polyangiaceae bacterium]